MNKTCPSITRTIEGAPSPATFQDTVEQLSIALRHVEETTVDRLYELTDYWFVQRKDFNSALDVLKRANLLEFHEDKVVWTGPTEDE
ncbi:MAG: hypothetical protein ACI8W8_004370 [Rhodothermales bacterium]|jgi:hypothetical protein